MSIRNCLPIATGNKHPKRPGLLEFVCSRKGCESRWYAASLPNVRNICAGRDPFTIRGFISNWASRIKGLFDKDLPPATEQIWNYVKATKSKVENGSKEVSDVEFVARLEICDLCPLRKGNKCTACGCGLADKARDMASHCPKGKWPGDARLDSVVVIIPIQSTEMIPEAVDAAAEYYKNERIRPVFTFKMDGQRFVTDDIPPAVDYCRFGLLVADAMRVDYGKKFDYFAVIDPRWKPLAQTVKALLWTQQQAQAGLAVGLDRNHAKRVVLKAQQAKRRLGSGFADSGEIHPGCVLLPKSSIDKIGYPSNIDDSFLVWADYAFRLKKKGSSFVSATSAHVNHKPVRVPIDSVSDGMMLAEMYGPFWLQELASNGSA